MNKGNTREIEAFNYVKDKFENEYDELYDALYYYMLTYLEDKKMDNYLFKDEIENLIGIRKHEDIIEYILKS